METKMLVCVDSKDASAGGKGNDHNKFYKASFDGSTIYYEYGRIGGHVTKGSKPGTPSAYHKLIQSKIKKGYVEVDTHEEGSTIDVNKDKRVAQVLTQDPKVQQVLDELVNANTHDLFEGKLKVTMTTSGAVMTEIGVLTSKTIQKAQGLLDLIRQGDLSLIKDYFTLIPHVVPVGTPIGQIVKDWDDELRLFEQLKQSVLDYEASMDQRQQEKVGDEVFQDLFKLKLRQATDQELDHIRQLFQSTVNHKDHYNASKMRVVNALMIDYNEDETNAYQATRERVGNVQELWHGTTAQNVLNILRAGLFCPKDSDHRFGVTGRMFGNGIYQSDQSTKALNYARGGWGQANHASHSYMFLTDTALGNSFVPNQKHHSQSKIPKLARDGGYDSITVKGGTYVMNNEMIVWNTDQIQLKALVLFQ